jgi:hypothetical protein
VTVQVTQGATASGLAPKLAQLGMVASSRAFVLAAERLFFLAYPGGKSGFSATPLPGM